MKNKLCKNLFVFVLLFLQILTAINSTYVSERAQQSYLNCLNLKQTFENLDCDKILAIEKKNQQEKEKLRLVEQESLNTKKVEIELKLANKEILSFSNSIFQVVGNLDKAVEKQEESISNIKEELKNLKNLIRQEIENVKNKLIKNNKTKTTILNTTLATNNNRNIKDEISNSENYGEKNNSKDININKEDEDYQLRLKKLISQAKINNSNKSEMKNRDIGINNIEKSKNQRKENPEEAEDKDDKEDTSDIEINSFVNTDVINNSVAEEIKDNNKSSDKSITQPITSSFLQSDIDSLLVDSELNPNNNFHQLSVNANNQQDSSESNSFKELLKKFNFENRKNNQLDVEVNSRLFNINSNSKDKANHMTTLKSDNNEKSKSTESFNNVNDLEKRLIELRSNLNKDSQSSNTVTKTLEVNKVRNDSRNKINNRSNSLLNDLSLNLDDSKNIDNINDKEGSLVMSNEKISELRKNLSSSKKISKNQKNNDNDNINKLKSKLQELASKRKLKEEMLQKQSRITSISNTTNQINNNVKDSQVNNINNNIKKPEKVNVDNENLKNSDFEINKKNDSNKEKSKINFDELEQQLKDLQNLKI